jgi:hypothetical protein
MRFNTTKAGRHKKEGIEANNQVHNIIKIIKFPNPSSNILDKDMTLVKFDKPLEINKLKISH